MKNNNVDFLRESLVNEKRYYSLNDIDSIATGSRRDVSFYVKKVKNGSIIKTENKYFESSFDAYIVDFRGFQESLDYIIESSVYAKGLENIKVEFRQAKIGEEKYEKQNFINSSYIYKGEPWVKVAFATNAIDGNSNGFLRVRERLNKIGKDINTEKIDGKVYRKGKLYYRALSFISLSDLLKLKSVASEDKSANFENFISSLKKYKDSYTNYLEVNKNKKEKSQNTLTERKNESILIANKEFTNSEMKILEIIRSDKDELENEVLMLRQRVKELEVIEEKYNNIKNLLS